jgi:lipopolysaccharide transport system permease protein
MEQEGGWEWEIKPKKPWFGTSFKELYSYKDLLFRLVRKEFLLRYQQTLLGPAWVLLQPLLSLIIYVVIFNKVIKVPIPDVPPVLFYLSGITLWTLFSDIFSSTSNTFLHNKDVFSKVYFPRLIAPLSLTFLHYVRFLIQLVLLFIILFYFVFIGKMEIHAFSFIIIIPIIILISAMGLGLGLIFSVLTAKYRDLSNILNLILSLLMFICPIFYSIDIVPNNIKWIVNINPLSTLFELFRFSLLGVGDFTTVGIIYSTISILFFLGFGLLWFNRKEDKLMDVI